MKIVRLNLTKQIHTYSHNLRDEYEAGEFAFVIEDGFVAVTRKRDGSTVAYPRELCILTLEPKTPEKSMLPADQQAAAG